MSQSNNTHVIRKRGSKVLFPYSEALAAKAGFVTLTMAEAMEQGLLDKRRHPKAPGTEAAEEMRVAVAEAKAEVAKIKAENDKLQAKLEVAMARGANVKAEVVDEPAEEIVAEQESAPSVADEASELSDLLAEIDNSPAKAG